MTWSNEDVLTILRATRHAWLMEHETGLNPLDEASADAIVERWDELFDALIAKPDEPSAKAALLAHAQVVLAFHW